MAEYEFDPRADAGDDTGWHELSGLDFEIDDAAFNLDAVFDAETTARQELYGQLASRMDTIKYMFGTSTGTGEWQSVHYNNTPDYRDTLFVSGHGNANGTDSYYIVLNREVRLLETGTQELSSVEYAIDPGWDRFSCRAATARRPLGEDDAWGESDLGEAIHLDILGDTLVFNRSVGALRATEAIDPADGLKLLESKDRLAGLVAELDANYINGYHYRPGVTDRFRSGL